MGITISLYDKLLNKAAPIVVPILVSLGAFFKPLYKLWDAIFKSMEPSEKRSATSNSYQPIVVFSSRTVKDVAKYKEAFAKHAEAAQSGGAGVRACFSFMERGKDATALQFAWYDSPADFVPQPSSLTSLYAGEGYTKTWGGWDEDLKAKLSAEEGSKFSFVKEVRGFLKSPGAATKEGFATGEPPMIWISRRDVLPGRMLPAGQNFQCGTDLMYGAAPAALGICEFTDEDNADQNWSLRVFNDYDTGFKAHFPVPSWILFRMVFNVIPEWVPGPFGIGFDFSSQEYVDNAVASNGGNAAYVPYIYESGALIGPAPDFGKGF